MCLAELQLPVGSESEAELKEKLSECLESPEGKKRPDEPDEGEVTVFHNIVYLGSG